MKVKLLGTLFFIFICVIYFPLFAADISVWEPYRDMEDFDWAKIIVIDGNIKSGDFNTLKRIYYDSKKSNDVIMGVALNSTGGDVIEAMKIGNFIRANSMMTISPSLAFDCPFPTDSEELCKCFSSCFIVWAAGVKRNGYLIGLHRPYFDKNFFADLNPTKAEEKYKEMSNLVKSYLQNMDIPNEIIEIMFEHSSDDLYLLPINFYEKLRIAPFFEEWVLANCGALTADEKKEYQKLKLVDDLSKYQKFYLDHLKSKQGEINRCVANRIKEIQQKD